VKTLCNCCNEQIAEWETEHPDCFQELCYDCYDGHLAPEEQKYYHFIVHIPKPNITATECDINLAQPTRR